MNTTNSWKDRLREETAGLVARRDLLRIAYSRGLLRDLPIKHKVLLRVQLALQNMLIWVLRKRAE